MITAARKKENGKITTSFKIFAMQQIVKTLVITNCTSRKKPISQPIRLSSVGGETLKELVLRWRSMVNCATPKHPAIDLYQGRSLSEIRRVRGILGADLKIISAGLGIVTSAVEIPNYDLSLSENGGAFLRELEKINATPIEWWTAVCQNFDQSEDADELLGSSTYDLILIALPPSYLRLLRPSLESHAPAIREKLRVFTSRIGKNEIPQALKACVMDYDDRLESLSEYSGTRSDFPQRALRHFTEEINGHTLALEEAQNQVKEFLKKYEKRKASASRRVDDEEILSIIEEDWYELSGKSNEILRNLRRVRKVACEQKRFSYLFRLVKARKEEI